MSDQAQQPDGPKTPFQQRVAEAMTAQVRVRIPDTNTTGGYREEWWSMERIYDVAWAAASDFMIHTAEEAQNIIDEQAGQ